MRAAKHGFDVRMVKESGTKGLSIEDEPAMGLRPAATGKLILEGAKVPATAILGEGRREDYLDCVSRARIAWASLSVGTSQAVLDYVIPYVNDRQAFGEPVSNRQGVAFAVSDIGIEIGKLLYWNRDPACEQPRVTANRPRLALLGGLLGCFLIGGVAGAWGFKHVGYLATLPLAVLLCLLAIVPALDDVRRLARRAGR